MSQTYPPCPLSDRAKHRLRLAARFLRQDGYQFNNGEFYQEVLARIATINQSQNTKLRCLVDWIEEYEIAEQKIFVVPPRSRALKRKTQFGNKGALRPSASGAIRKSSGTV